MEAYISKLWCQTANMVPLKINITLVSFLEKGFFVFSPLKKESLRTTIPEFPLEAAANPV